MNIIPAIDLLKGKCVRLYKGDYNTASQVAADPIETAKRFIDEGATKLHVVDLDGAKEGKQRNFKLLEKLASLNITVQTGGGIRNMETVKSCFSAGVNEVIIGSAAVTDNTFLKQLIVDYPDKIIVGIDAKDGFVRTSGWTNNSNINYLVFAESLFNKGIKKIIYTDISRDGTLEGVNLEELSALKAKADCKIIASGGVRDIRDIDNLLKLELYGVICGKSIYSGSLSLKKAIERSKCYQKG